MLRAMLLCYWKINMLCLALELVGSCVELGFSAGGFWMCSCQLMFPGVRRSLLFSGFGFKPPASGFQFILIVASRPLHPYSTNDSTSKIVERKFSTMRDTQRDPHSYMEKRRRDENDPS